MVFSLNKSYKCKKQYTFKTEETMRKVTMILLIILIGLAAMSCATYTIPVAATSNTMGSKVGVATGVTYLGYFGEDTQTGIQQAAANGGITNISSVDFSFNMGILGIVQTYTCTVTGE